MAGSWTPYGKYRLTGKLELSDTLSPSPLVLQSGSYDFTPSQEMLSSTHLLVQVLQSRLHAFTAELALDLSSPTNISTSASEDSPDNPSSAEWISYLIGSGKITKEFAEKYLPLIEKESKSPPHLPPIEPEPEQAWNEINEQDIDYITEQLNNVNNYQREFEIVKTKPYAPNSLVEPVDSPNIMVTYIVIRVSRKVWTPDPRFRYWIDVAYRWDTGEPLVIVTHKGDMREWLNADPNNPKGA